MCVKFQLIFNIELVQRECPMHVRSVLTQGVREFGVMAVRKMNSGGSSMKAQVLREVRDSKGIRNNIRDSFPPILHKR